MIARSYLYMTEATFSSPENAAGGFEMFWYTNLDHTFYLDWDHSLSHSTQNNGLHLIYPVEMLYFFQDKTDWNVLDDVKTKCFLR